MLKLTIDWYFLLLYFSANIDFVCPGVYVASVVLTGMPGRGEWWGRGWNGNGQKWNSEKYK